MSNVLREIGSNIAKLRALLSENRKDLTRLQTLQTSLQETLQDVWQSDELNGLSRSAQAWKEFVGLVSSGRILTITAQTNEALNAGSSGSTGRYWIGNGREYARWLGRGISHLAGEKPPDAAERDWKPVAGLCGKSFSLGYTDEIISTIISHLLLAAKKHKDQFQALIAHLAPHEQRLFLLSSIEFISKQFFSQAPPTDTLLAANRARTVSACAALLYMVIPIEEDVMTDHVSDWLMKGPSTAVDVYRSVVIATPVDKREEILNKAWAKFADKLFIKHAPIVQQEAFAKIVLILIGAAHKKNPMSIFVLARSSMHTQGTSARLASSSPRVRFLGMAVAKAVSQLVDKPDQRVGFDFDGDEKPEFDYLDSLIKLEDTVGTIDDLPKMDSVSTTASRTTASQSQGLKPLKLHDKPKKSKPVSKIQVIESEGESSDEELPTYGKPDSDASDSDDDPTTARRQKPKAPVYIRGLISGLSNTEEHDVLRLALTIAPSLIRRKADFGSELSDRAVELCSTYFNMSDPFSFDDFLELKLQGMTALLIAQPKICAPYFATTVFGGDFNLGQRVAGLSAMGLAARELAGYKDDDGETEQRFPTQTLPERLHKLYLEGSEFHQVSKRMEDNMMGAVSSKSKRPRQKLIRNDLSKLVADYFFFPLSNNFVAHQSGLPSLNRLLPTLLRTFAIILTSAGSSTLALSQLTNEFFGLLLSLRTRALNDPSVLEALLFGFLSLLNVNSDKRGLAERHSREIMECHEWCNLVFEKISEGSGLRIADEETERSKTLAAGVLVATKELVENYERVILGNVGSME